LNFYESKEISIEFPAASIRIGISIMLLVAASSVEPTMNQVLKERKHAEETG